MNENIDEWQAYTRFRELLQQNDIGIVKGIVKVKKLYDDSIIPTKGSAEAAGFDLYLHLDENDTKSEVDSEGRRYIKIFPHETVKLSTGIAVAIPYGYEGEVRPRSGLATKQGLRPANSPGTIDSDYRGEVFVALHKDPIGKITEPYSMLYNGDRIAQLLIKEVPPFILEEVDELDETERGAGGFGSTGTH